jgi:hypothetical protein
MVALKPLRVAMKVRITACSRQIRTGRHTPGTPQWSYRNKKEHTPHVSSQGKQRLHAQKSTHIGEPPKIASRGADLLRLRKY